MNETNEKYKDETGKINAANEAATEVAQDEAAAPPDFSDAPPSRAKIDAIFIIKFICFSMGAAIIEFCSFALLSLISKEQIWTLVFQVISVALSVLFNLTLNRKYTFKSTNNYLRVATLYALLYAIITPLFAWLLLGLINLGVHELLSKLITMVLTLIVEFTYTNLIIYRKK
jgi:putative flippase GtrA